MTQESKSAPDLNQSSPSETEIMIHSIMNAFNNAHVPEIHVHVYVGCLDVRIPSKNLTATLKHNDDTELLHPSDVLKNDM